MAVARIRHGVVVTADVRENRPKMKLDNNRVFEYAISFPDGLLYTLGLSMNAIAKQLGVSTPSILNWIRAQARHVARPQPEPGESVVVMELDELWHFLQKKNKLWIWLAFDRSASSTGNVAIVMPPR